MTTAIRLEALSPADLKPIPKELAFGRAFTNRMYTQRYQAGQGWHDAVIGPYRSLTLDPATVSLHYSQAIFEGTKAYRRPDGRINLFRPWENARRFNRSAERMAMPAVDVEAHVEAMTELVRLEHEWVPDTPGATLYLRPTMIADEPTLEVRASRSYLHYIILSPVGAYFAGGFKPVSVYVETEHVRAVRGGTGAAKTGGNYAASLSVSEQARQLGYQQVLWLDAVERRYVEEVGAMNIAFVYEGRHIRTPALSGSILPGVTRDSVLKLAPDLGYTVSEDRIDINEVRADLERGAITEVFGLGTAAVVAPVGRLGFQGRDLPVHGDGAGPVAQRLYEALTDLQYGRAPDPYGWTLTITPSV